MVNEGGELMEIFVVVRMLGACSVFCFGKILY